MKRQIAEVQESQAKMWGAISRMGEELRGLATRENDSDSEHEEEEAAPKDSPAETSVQRCSILQKSPNGNKTATERVFNRYPLKPH